MPIFDWCFKCDEKHDLDEPCISKKHFAGSSLCPCSPCTECFTIAEEEEKPMATGALRYRLRRIADSLERKTNNNKYGHGEHVCQFCDARGCADVEHKDGCPIGELWVIVGEL